MILATLEIGHRDIIPFVSNQQKYIIAIEATMLAIFIVEMAVSFITLFLRTPQLIEHGARLRLIVRIIGYFIALMSVISIIASNPTLGISVGAIAGVVIAFATQNIVGNVLAAILILSTQMIKIGEEITVSQTKGIVSDINLTNTVITVEDEIIFIPNSLITSTMVRRKKRNLDKSAGTRDW